MNALNSGEDATSLGVFDEESCRYFLREVGYHIVLRTTFEYGIEEVYTLILEKYGFDGLPDATSLLQELLEDDQYSAGSGDDGDVWRSWRLDWRRRNNDPSNPFVPKVGLFVLQPPTAPEVRRRKAINFLELQPAPSLSLHMTSIEECHEPEQEQTSSEQSYPGLASVIVDPPSSTTATEHRESVITDEPDHTYLQNYDFKQNEGDSKQDLGTFTTSIRAGDLDPDVLVSLDLTPSKRCRPNLSSEEQSSVRTLQLIDTSPATHVFGSSTMGSVLSRSPPGLPDPITNSQSTITIKADDLSGSHQAGLVRRANRHSFPESGVMSSDLRIAHVLAQHQLSQDASTSPLKASPESLGTRMKRAAHRQARLIDGAIFNNRCQRAESRTGNHTNNIEEEKTCGKRSSLRLSWFSGTQKQPVRQSWIKGVRSRFFCRNPVHKQSNHTARANSTAEHVGCTSFLSRPSLAPSAGESMPSAHPFGLDGIIDAHRTSSPSNLNKLLPLSPEQIVRTLSSRNRAGSLTTSHSAPERRPLSGSIATSEVSQLSKKEYFRLITQQILEGYEPLPQRHELQPVADSDTQPYQHECDPGRMDKISKPPLSYTSISHQNPFTDDLVPVTPGRAPPSAWRTPEGSINHTPDLPTSQTSTAREHKSANDGFSTSDIGPPVRPTHRPAPLDLSQISNGKTSDSRGRVASPQEPTTNSDQKIKVKEPAAPLRSPSRRSRSPIKRLFGLGKSVSSKDFSSVSEIKAIDSTPESTKKSSINKWSHKLRHGFLNNDQEQLAEEAKLAEHLANAASTSPPTQSTFPISIDPPHQARIRADIELMLCVTTNRFLMHEAKHGRISAESVSQIRKRWEILNRPQVIEFMYDLATQYELVMANVKNLDVHGPATQDAILLTSTLYGWKSMAREMSIRTFCESDSTIRKYLHEAHRVLELLSAPSVTMMAFQDLQLKTLSMISDKQKERMVKEGKLHSGSSSTRNISSGSQPGYTVSKDGGVHRRNVSEGSVRVGIAEMAFAPEPLQPSRARTPANGSLGHSRKATGAVGALMK